MSGTIFGFHLCSCINLIRLGSLYDDFLFNNTHDARTRTYTMIRILRNDLNAQIWENRVRLPKAGFRVKRTSLIDSDNNLHPSFTRTFFVSNIKIRQKHEGA